MIMMIMICVFGCIVVQVTFIDNHDDDVDDHDDHVDDHDNVVTPSSSTRSYTRQSVPSETNINMQSTKIQSEENTRYTNTH